MSALLFIASDRPLPERENPHIQTLSVNEALARGMEVHEFLLRPDFDRDKPDVILWSDSEILIDVDHSTVSDNGFDDDFAIWTIEDGESLAPAKPCRAYIEWLIGTEGRAEQVIGYLKEQLENTDEIELWHIWQDGTKRFAIQTRRIAIDDLRPADIIELDDREVYAEPLTRYCLRITRDRAYAADIAETRKYWQAHGEQCICLYCQNYRKALAAHCPETVRILEGLGLRHDRALEITECSWNETQDKRVYEACYAVKGSLRKDQYMLSEGEAAVTLYQPRSAARFCPLPADLEEPWFMAVVEVELPWEMETIPWE